MKLKLSILFLVLAIVLGSCTVDRSGCAMSKGFVGIGGQHPAGMNHR